jgi:NhaA family Na+:H+ antiporter
MRRLTLDYLRTESGAGLILIGAAALAIAWANSPWAASYFGLVATPLPVRIGAFAQTMSLAGWVRTGLMAVVFLVLGMGLKFELTRGELVGPRRFALPALAALGGLVGPALVYLALNLGPGGAPAGWTTACATDSAAALGLLGLLAPRLAPSLRVLLMSVALADNLAASVIAAILAPGELRLRMVVGALSVLALLALLSRWRRAPFLFYAGGVVLVWAFTLKSGFDAALAGAACALTVPVGARRAGQESTLKYFMESLHPYVAFAILPLFAFTAAGVSLTSLGPADLLAPASLGLILALAIGKPLGVLGLTSLGMALKLARRPTGATWLQLAAVAQLCGVGLTFGYVIAGMTREAAPQADPAIRAAIVIASALAAFSGGWLVALTQRPGDIADSVRPRRARVSAS